MDLQGNNTGSFSLNNKSQGSNDVNINLSSQNQTQPNSLNLKKDPTPAEYNDTNEQDVLKPIENTSENQNTEVFHQDNQEPIKTSKEVQPEEIPPEQTEPVQPTESAQEQSEIEQPTEEPLEINEPQQEEKPPVEKLPVEILDTNDTEQMTEQGFTPFSPHKIVLIKQIISSTLVFILWILALYLFSQYNLYSGLRLFSNLVVWLQGFITLFYFLGTLFFIISIILLYTLWKVNVLWVGPGKILRKYKAYYRDSAVFEVPDKISIKIKQSPFARKMNYGTITFMSLSGEEIEALVNFKDPLLLVRKVKGEITSASTKEVEKHID